MVGAKLGGGVLLALVLALFAGRPAAAPAPPGGSQGARAATADYVRAASWLEGSFSNASQAARDRSFRDVRLRIVPIWQGRTEARWFYLERAAAGQEAKPDLQRIHRLTLSSDGTIAAAAFTLPGAERYVGAAKDTALLSALAPSALVPEDGCALYLRKRGSTYKGATEGQKCGGGAPGAAYSTREIEIGANGIKLLERAYDQAGKQVAGSTKGAYDLRRQ